MRKSWCSKSCAYPYVVTQEVEGLVDGCVCIKGRRLEAEFVLHDGVQALSQPICCQLQTKLLLLSI